MLALMRRLRQPRLRARVRPRNRSGGRGRVRARVRGRARLTGAAAAPRADRLDARTGLLSSAVPSQGRLVSTTAQGGDLGCDRSSFSCSQRLRCSSARRRRYATPQAGVYHGVVNGSVAGPCGNEGEGTLRLRANGRIAPAGNFQFCGSPASVPKILAPSDFQCNQLNANLSAPSIPVDASGAFGPHRGRPDRARGRDAHGHFPRLLGHRHQGRRDHADPGRRLRSPGSLEDEGRLNAGPAQGCSPSSASRSSVSEPRTTVSDTRSPGAWVAIVSRSSFEVGVSVPSSAVITSPALTFAPSAGPPALTETTATPPEAVLDLGTEVGRRRRHLRQREAFRPADDLDLEAIADRGVADRPRERLSAGDRRAVQRVRSRRRRAGDCWSRRAPPGRRGRARPPSTRSR